MVVSGRDERIGRQKPVLGQGLPVRPQAILRFFVPLRPTNERDSPELVVLHQVSDPLSQALFAVNEDAGHPVEFDGDTAHRPWTVALAIVGEVIGAQVVGESPGQEHETIDAVGTGEVVDNVVPLA